MKKSTLQAVLQARPWLKVCIQYLTGAHPFHVEEAGGNWDEHVMEWSIRNISEITIRQFDDLNLDEKSARTESSIGERNEFNYSDPTMEQVVYDAHGLRNHRAFVHIKFWCFSHKTYMRDDEAERGGDYTDPYSLCFSLEKEDYSQSSLREYLKHMSNPHYVTIGGTRATVESPFILDALIRVTQVGISGRCSSTIIDIFPFPEGFDAKNL